MSETKCKCGHRKWLHDEVCQDGLCCGEGCSCAGYEPAEPVIEVAPGEPKFTPPRYDEAYFEAMNMIDEIDGRPHTYESPVPAVPAQPAPPAQKYCDCPRNMPYYDWSHHVDCELYMPLKDDPAVPAQEAPREPLWLIEASEGSPFTTVEHGVPAAIHSLLCDCSNPLGCALLPVISGDSWSEDYEDGWIKAKRLPTAELQADAQPDHVPDAKEVMGNMGAGAQVPSQDECEHRLSKSFPGVCDRCSYSPDAGWLQKTAEGVRAEVNELPKLRTRLATIKSYATEAAKTPITREDMHDPLKAQTFYDEAKGFERLVLSEIGGSK